MLNNYDGVLSQLEEKEEIELEVKENKTKKEKIENEGVKKSASKEKVEREIPEKINAGDNLSKATWYDLGFLQSKVVKNIFCCLSERQQIGKKILSQLILSNRHLINSTQGSSS